MKQKWILLSTVLLSILFLAGSSFLKSFSPAEQKIGSEDGALCKSESIGCKVIAPLRKDIAVFLYETRRGSINKNDLPVMRIYMSDGAVAKLNEKRKSVLAKDRPIHISESGDWVRASVLVEFEDRKEKSNVSLRLKGDWGDHMKDPKKLSFRIKTRSGGYLFGLKVFSIQHPVTRNFSNEPMLLDQMRRHGILAPRSSFVDVRINDYPIGIMGLEEHFQKEMLEAQNRRDGPILALDEGPLWDQWDLNLNSPNPLGDLRVNFFHKRDIPVRNYRETAFVRGEIPTNNAIRSVALLRDFYGGKASARAVFDYDLLSKYWVLTNVWAGCHSAAWHNRRHYFNPITGLLEPISFDNVPSPSSAFRYCVPDDVQIAIRDPEFLAKTFEFAGTYFSELQSADFNAKFELTQSEYDRILGLEGFEAIPRKFTTAQLRKNLLAFLEHLRDDLEPLESQSAPTGKPIERGVRKEFLSAQPLLAIHMSAFYFPTEIGRGVIEFRNLSAKEIAITRLMHIGRKNTVTDIPFPTVHLDPATTNPRATSQSVDIPEWLLARKGVLVAEYGYGGVNYTTEVALQFRGHDSGFAPLPLKSLGDIVGEHQIDRTHKEVIISAGAYTFDQSISLPKGWRVKILPGAVVNFKNGSLLKIQGPLLIRGSESNPVLINIESSLTYRDMGAWGGVLVSNSPEHSSVSHLILNGSQTQNLANRQGFFGLTGCISFYASDVTITNTHFRNAQCEDALNITRSNFVLDRVTIDGARADAFDSDFATGIIRRSHFLRSGNDGIDVSGSLLEINRTMFEEIGDKAISVGEKSNLHARDVEVNGAVLGVASKDLSYALLERAVFNGVTGTALMTYIKKQEYGPSSIDCASCIFDPEIVVSGLQGGTKITVNGRRAKNKYLTEKQLVDAGLTEGVSVF